jgi:N-acetylglucosaminyldiphosphoundecaprenol N-acetyl-beta-D-mannosaminyltransferase
VKLYNILGTNCYQFNTISDAKALIKEIVTSEKGGYSVAINAEKIMMYSRDIDFRTILDESILPIPDGSGAIIGMKILHRINSIKLDLPKTIFECADESKFSFFILGATEKVNFNAENSLNQKYPGINVLGRQNGYYEDESVMIQQIKKLNPQIVMIAMGSPKQEKLARRMHEIVPSALLIGCGGALNILTGEAKRAPLFYQRNHLEWFYRLAKEPFRFKRQLKLPIFLIKLIIEKYKRK